MSNPEYKIARKAAYAALRQERAISGCLVKLIVKDIRDTLTGKKPSTPFERDSKMRLGVAMRGQDIVIDRQKLDILKHMDETEDDADDGPTPFGTNAVQCYSGDL